MKKLKEPTVIAAIITAVSAIIVAVIGIIFGKTLIQVVYSPSDVTLTSTAVAHTTPTNEPSTPIPSPTPTPQVVLINQTMTCTNCENTGFNFSLIIKNATIDPANRQVTFLVGVQNNMANTDSPMSFTFLKLQDTQTGASVDGTGEGFSPFTITAKQTLLFRPTLPFVPVVGHEYSLSAELSGYDFTPITIKF